MNTAEEFLNIYNTVDHLITTNDNYETFSSKIRKSKNPIIKNYQSKLISFGELRNAIVHNNRNNGEYIAYPREDVVVEFRAILEKLEKPKGVYPLFSFEVIGAHKEDKINSMIKVMRENSFSQFPVFDDNNKVIELINTNTISRWIGKHFDKDNIVLIENATVGDILEDQDNIEFKNNYKFISKYSDIYTAYDYFLEFIKKENRNLDVLFITENGKASEKLLGLITIEDIALSVKY